MYNYTTIQIPVRTAFAVGSERSRAVFPSVFLIFGSAICCSRTGRKESTCHHSNKLTLNPFKSQITNINFQDQLDILELARDVEIFSHHSNEIATGNTTNGLLHNYSTTPYLE